MNWFKENKFLSILLIITLILAGLIAYVGMGAAGKASETAEAIESKKSNITRLESGKPYPSTVYLKEKKENLQAVLAKAGEARALLLKYRPKEINNTTASSFTALFDETEQNLQKLYKSKDITLPEDWHMGFEKYKTSPVDEKNTGILSYEMKAMDWLFRTVAEAGVSKVTGFYREPLPPEVGKEWNAPTAPAGKPADRPRPQQAQSAASAPVAKSLPFEIALEGREQSLRKLLTDLSNSQEHFVVVRALRVQNEKMDPPNQKQVGFKEENAAPAGGDIFGDGGFVFPTEGAEETPEPEAAPEGEPAAEGAEEPAEDAAPAAAEPADSGRILQIVAGDEKIKYFIRGELLLFDDTATLPEVK